VAGSFSGEREESAVHWVPLLLILCAVGFDLRRREIPDAIPLSLLAFTVGATALGTTSHGWSSMLFGFGCAAAAGVVLFSVGAFGGGDVKLLAALGAALGARELVPLLFYVAIAGALLAGVAVARGKRDLAYAPAIALGLLWLTFTRGFR